VDEPIPSGKASAHDHAERAISSRSLERAAQLFRAMGDAPRLRILDVLTNREMCVTEIVAAVREKFSTVSQRLRILRQEGLVARRRHGNHLYYALADRHVADLILNALAHAHELTAALAPASSKEMLDMADTHEHHDHQHGPNCGHTAIQHDGHTDYLHDGHLHHQSGTKVEEHRVPVSSANPASCTADHACSGHDKTHRHGAGCGHEAVPHGDHVDYLVDGHLHHPHGGHCDDHGTIQKA
jgi:DNA-binding transcriptional ArsR family regulator